MVPVTATRSVVQRAVGWAEDNGNGLGLGTDKGHHPNPAVREDDSPPSLSSDHLISPVKPRSVERREGHGSKETCG